MTDHTCTCPPDRTDHLPPCGKVCIHKRPDGYYCDCGHSEDCCKAERLRRAALEAERRKL